MKLPVLSPGFHNRFWLWGLPLLSVLLIALISQASRDIVEAVVISPFGITENLPTVFLAFGVAYAVAIFRLPNARALRGWMVVYAIALIFFAGEDQNWFQYWLGAEVPPYFLENNKEQEINLHNISSWFNQKPRLVVEMWALFACVLIPLGYCTAIRRKTSGFIPDALWPDRRVVPIAILSLVLSVARSTAKALEISIDKVSETGAYDFMTEAFPGVRISEMEEIGFAYLMLLFVALLYGSLVSAKATKPAKKRVKKSK